MNVVLLGFKNCTTCESIFEEIKKVSFDARYIYLDDLSSRKQAEYVGDLAFNGMEVPAVVIQNEEGEFIQGWGSLDSVEDLDLETLKNVNTSPKRYQGKGGGPVRNSIQPCSITGNLRCPCS